jgi:hypothetical protein
MGMTQNEMITDFKLAGESVNGLLKAVNKHLKKAGCEPEEYGFDSASWVRYSGAKDQLLPPRSDFRWLVAWVVEGGSEGYYIHLGAILARRTIEMNTKHDEIGGTLKAVYTPGEDTSTYLEFGLAKTYSAESAYAICREAQRFLTAAEWN